MKPFGKFLLCLFLCFSIAIVLGSYSYLKINGNSLSSNIGGGGEYKTGKDREGF